MFAPVLKVSTTRAISSHLIKLPTSSGPALQSHNTTLFIISTLTDHPLHPRRQHIKRLGNLRLPGQLILSENLRVNAELLAALEKDGADDIFVAENGLVVIDVRGAVRAVVAVDWVS
ncbi:hypothetical protein MMC06_000104 [Schaereria dolodes]|nr:hypothetical protein [Schaereria dolodes]